MTEQPTKDVFKSLLNDYSFVLVLIREVKSTPELWDTRKRQYWDMLYKQEREHQWASITKALGNRFGHLSLKPEDIPVSVIKRKWENIRMDYYKITRRSVKVSPTSEARRFFIQLKFLGPVIMKSKRNIEKILKRPSDVLGKALTKLTAEIFFPILFNDDTFIELILGEVEKRPILWDSRLPEYFNAAAWYSLLKSFDGTFETLDSTILDIAVSCLIKKWYNLKSSYITHISGTVSISARNDVERFAELLEFLKPVIKKQNSQIPDDDRNKKQVSASDEIRNSEKGPSAVNIASNEKNVKSIQQDCRTLTAETSSRVTETCENIAASNSIPFCDFNLLDFSSYENIPNNFQEDISNKQVPASKAFPSYEEISNSSEQDSLSGIPEQSPKVTSQSTQFPSSSVISSCAQNLPDILSTQHMPNNIQDDIHSAQGPALVAFPSSEQVPDKFDEDFISWISEQFPTITAPRVQLPSSSAISSCAQNSPVILSYRNITNNSQPVTSCELEFPSKRTDEFGYDLFTNEINEFLRQDSNMEIEVDVNEHIIDSIPQL